MLAATGLSNKQIGNRLYLSHRTVGAHLYRVFPKLGITSRAALRDALPPVSARRSREPAGRRDPQRDQVEDEARHAADHPGDVDAAERPDQRADVEGLIDERHLDGDRQQVGDQPAPQVPAVTAVGVKNDATS